MEWPFCQDNMFAMFCSNTVKRYQNNVLNVMIASHLQILQHLLFIHFHNVHFSWHYRRLWSKIVEKYMLLYKIASSMIPAAAFFCEW